jgi:tetratricopeptide (TPR) repeat protein
MDQELDNKAGVARHVGNLGTLYAELGDYDQAVEHFKQALAMNRAFGFVPSVAGWLNNLGIMARDKGDLQAALEYFDEAIPLHRSIGKKDRLGESLIDKAEVLILLGRAAEARELADEGLALAHETQTSRSIEQGEILRARLNFLDGDPTALADLQALLAAAGGPKEQANLHYWLWRLGRSAEHARQARQLYATLVERTPEVLFRRRLAEIEKSEVRSQDSEVRSQDSEQRNQGDSPD